MVNCPSGKLATGGGAFATQTIAAVYKSVPVGDPATSWQVTAAYNGPEGRVPGSIAFTLTAYVVCARFTNADGEVPVSTATSAGTISENNDNQLAGEARYGNRGRAIGGGFSNESGRRHLESGLIGDVDSVFGASGWRTAAPSSFGDPEDLRSYAICVGGIVEGLEVVEATVANREAIRTINAYCPPGKHALAGGFSINLIGGYEWWQTPEGTGPIGWHESSWGWTSFFRTLSLYVNMGFDQLGTTKAICALVGE
jgi:hypothetical protein